MRKFLVVVFSALVLISMEYLAYAGLNDGLIAHWNFNECNAADSTGNGYDGTVFGNILCVDGMINKALNFDATDDHIQLSKTLDANSTKSLSFWINTRGPDGRNDAGIVLAKYSWFGRRSFLIYSHDGDTSKILVKFYSDGVSYDGDSISSYYENPEELDSNKYTIINNYELETNVWNHVAVNVTETEIEIWINGIITNKVKRDYQQYFNSGEPTYIGNAFLIGGDFTYDYRLNGILDDLRIYDRTLNEEEILALYSDDEDLVRDFVTRFYQLCLDRDPDLAGLDVWVSDLLDGKLTGSDVAYGFVFSNEFINKNTTNEEYLTVLYEAFFNRQPDPAGWQGWLEAMKNGTSRQDVLNGFIFAVEFAELCDAYGILAYRRPDSTKELVKDFVTRFYQLCLGREPDPAGLNGWVTALLDGSQTGSDVAYGFVFSSEFIDRNTTNEEYLTVLYEAFFNRQPDPAGWQGWMDALNSGTSREDVLNGFIFAPEFAELCNEYKIIPYDPLKRDDDGDGFSEFQGDCNDSNQNIHPGAVEVCGDGIDQDCDGSDLVCYNSWIVGNWKVAHVEGVPPGVTYTGSWRFKTNDTYEISFYSPGYYDVKGGGNYNLNGNILFVDGIVAESFDSPQGISLPLTISQDSNTFQFRDDDGDQWTWNRVQ